MERKELAKEFMQESSLMPRPESQLSSTTAQSKPVPRDLMFGLNHNFDDKRAKNKAQEFRQLYEELDPEYYEEEAPQIKIHPELDGRCKVDDTTIYPFSAHGRLIMFFNGYVLYGSGTLINSRYVLTAAHNLYSH